MFDDTMGHCPFLWNKFDLSFGIIARIITARIHSISLEDRYFPWNCIIFENNWLLYIFPGAVFQPQDDIFGDGIPFQQGVYLHYVIEKLKTIILKQKTITESNNWKQ